MFSKIKKSLFGEKAKTESKNSDWDFTGSSADEIIEALKNIGENIPFNFLLAAQKQLFDIAYHDYDQSDVERVKAERVLELVINTCEKCAQDNPALFKIHQEATAYSKEMARKWGIGSVLWAMRGSTDVEDHIEAMMNPKSASTIPAAIEAMGEGWANLKPLVIRRIIETHRKRDIDNAVAILAGGVFVRDSVLWKILDAQELAALLNCQRNYKAARTVLVKYDLIPHKWNAAPLLPLPPMQYIKLIVLSATQHSATQDNGEHHKHIENLMALFKIYLCLEMLKDIYGEEISANIKAEIMKTGELSGIETHLDRISHYIQEAAQEKLKMHTGQPMSPATAIAIGFLDDMAMAEAYIPLEKQSELVGRLQMIIGIEYAECIQYFRYLLRYFVSANVTDEKAFKQMLDEEANAYEAVGSKSSQRDDLLLGEDFLVENK